MKNLRYLLLSSVALGAIFNLQADRFTEIEKNIAALQLGFQNLKTRVDKLGGAESAEEIAAQEAAKAAELHAIETARAKFEAAQEAMIAAKIAAEKAEIAKLEELKSSLRKKLKNASSAEVALSAINEVTAEFPDLGGSAMYCTFLIRDLSTNDSLSNSDKESVKARLLEIKALIK